MQTSNAAAWRSCLESKGLAKVIFSHEGDDFVCVQYHPKGIKGKWPSSITLYIHLEMLTLVLQVA
jgi:hypothetical protein